MLAFSIASCLVENEVLACRCMFDEWKVDRLTGVIVTSGSGPGRETQALNK